MIVADRNELEMQLRTAALKVREKELIAFTDNFSVLSTQSVFLTGLGYSGLIMTPVWYSTRRIFLQLLFYTFITLAIWLNIMTMCITSWSMIFGPGLGIRGPDGSMKRAVMGMRSERKWALRFYWAGLVSMMVAGICLSWLKFACLFKAPMNWRSGCFVTPSLMTILFVGFSGWVYYHIMYVTRPRFKWADSKDRESDLMRFGDYDPETGEEKTGKNTAEIRESEKEAVVQGIKRIEWLEEQGLVSPKEAKKQKSALVEKFALAGASGTTFRAEKTGIGSSSGNGGGSSSSAGMPKTRKAKSSRGGTTSMFPDLPRS